MGRCPRIQFPGASYHLTVRGNNRRLIVIDDRDRAMLLSLLGGTVAAYGWRCHSYCLMNNHYHLVIDTPEPNLAAGMCRLNGTYARLFNQRHGRRDHLLGGRYGASLIETDEYFIEACRYVALNPVRAGLCETAEEWRWSSYAAIVGLERAPAWFTVDRVLGYFASNTIEARAAYARFNAASAAPASGHGLIAPAA